MLERAIAKVHFVCPYVSPSVRLVVDAYRVQDTVRW